MRSTSFRFKFDPIDNSYRQVEVIDGVTGAARSVRVSIDEQQFWRRQVARIPSLLADLIDIAVAVHVADRVAVRSQKQRCTLELTLPIRQPEVFNQLPIRQQLETLLSWYTGDDWTLIFSNRGALRRQAEREAILEFPSSDTVEVSLWSGGLDAFAGFFQRFQDGIADKYVLFGTGSSYFIQKKQKETFDGLPKHIRQSCELVQVPIHVQAETLPLADHQLLRSRGFVFLTLGAVWALLAGQHRLCVHENGIGAINLPFSAAEVGLDHARSVHPRSLQELGNFISRVLGETFIFHNPFLFSTKAQMCRTLRDAQSIDLAYQTVSCDRRHRDPNAVQCGRCSSCILRRHALAVLGVADQTPYVYSDFWLQGDLGPNHSGNHLPAMLFQVQKLRKALSAQDPWQGLCQLDETLLFDVADQIGQDDGMTDRLIESRLVELYQQYVDEWAIIQNTVPQLTLT